jgi:hypothetical protein
MTKQQILNTIQPMIKTAIAAGNTEEVAILVDIREMALSKRCNLVECESRIRDFYASVKNGTNPYVASLTVELI